MLTAPKITYKNQYIADLTNFQKYLANFNLNEAYLLAAIVGNLDWLKIVEERCAIKFRHLQKWFY